jgi:hypothetical protein
MAAMLAPGNESGMPAAMTEAPPRLFDRTLMLRGLSCARQLTTTSCRTPLPAEFAERLELVTRKFDKTWSLPPTLTACSRAADKRQGNGSCGSRSLGR